MKKLRIIIAENDEDEQFFMMEGFNATGLFDVTGICGNGNELVLLLEQQADSLPDLVLSDLNMPGRNGYEVLSFMKQHPVFRQVPVIILSTSSTQSTIEKCRQLGALDYLVKPETFNHYETFARQLYNSFTKTPLG